MTTLFVSDLHLASERPEALALFARFVARAQVAAKAVYILGDLFEVWIGDDDDSPLHQEIITALRALSNAGVALHVALGNRDFLLGKDFAKATGAQLLPDYAVVELYGERALLTHGDLLCTRDIKYQRFRRVVRNPVVRYVFSLASLAWRRGIAQRTQTGTKASMAGKPPDIMDVDDTAVATAMAKYDSALLIHGHTHRPDNHEFESHGVKRRRIVLGDWYAQGDVLVCDEHGQRRIPVSEFVA